YWLPTLRDPLRTGAASPIPASRTCSHGKRGLLIRPSAGSSASSSRRSCSRTRTICPASGRPGTSCTGPRSRTTWRRPASSPTKSSRTCGSRRTEVLNETPREGQAMRRRPALVIVLTLAVLIPAALPAAEAPRRGGILLAAIGADAPSLDAHQESTFATIEMVSPLYSTLLQIDPYNYPRVIGDLATEWKVSPDGLTYTFKIHSGVRFHDGSPLTAADVKASYDKIIAPPPGVRSVRKTAYSAIASVGAPDASTAVFKLKFPSASLFENLASPANVIFPKKYLDKDPNYFKTNVIGSGPFKFKNYVRGSTFEGERNPDYFVKDRPYLDGYKF